jgi:hypothetical protein
MNFDNTSSILEPNVIIKQDSHNNIDSTKMIYVRYIFGNFESYAEIRDGENRKGLYHFKFTHDFDYPETLKFTKGDWSEVEIDSNGNRTENRSHNETQKEHVGRWRKNSYI